MINPSKYKHIIWDWNGTLLDDAWLFVDVMNTVLKNRKMAAITLKKYRDIFGFPVKDYYLKLGFNLENEPFEKSGLEFIKAYEQRRYEARLHGNAIALLKKLSINGISHSILSAQHQHLLNDLTEYYQIREFFIQVIGLNNHYAHSKVSNGVNWVKELNVNRSQILMIGDTDHDFEVAEAIGIDCLLLSHGHHNHSRLTKTGVPVFRNFTDLLNLIQFNPSRLKPYQA